MTKTESLLNIKQINYEDIQNHTLGDYLVDPIPDSSNSNHKDWMAYRRIMNEFLGVKGLIGNNFAWWCTLTFCSSIVTTSAMIFPQKKKITFSFVKSSNKFLTLGSAHVLYTWMLSSATPATSRN